MLKMVALGKYNEVRNFNDLYGLSAIASFLKCCFSAVAHLYTITACNPYFYKGKKAEPNDPAF